LNRWIAERDGAPALTILGRAVYADAEAGAPAKLARVRFNQGGRASRGLDVGARHHAPIDLMIDDIDAAHRGYADQICRRYRSAAAASTTGSRSGPSPA